MTYSGCWGDYVRQTAWNWPARGPSGWRGEGSLLAEPTKRVLESALEGGLTDHLGRGRHEVTSCDQVPSHRNGPLPTTASTMAAKPSSKP